MKQEERTNNIYRSIDRSIGKPHGVCAILIGMVMMKINQQRYGIVVIPTNEYICILIGAWFVISILNFLSIVAYSISIDIEWVPRLFGTLYSHEGFSYELLERECDGEREESVS